MKRLIRSRFSVHIVHRLVLTVPPTLSVVIVKFVDGQVMFIFKSDHFYIGLLVVTRFILLWGNLHLNFCVYILLYYNLIDSKKGSLTWGEGEDCWLRYYKIVNLTFTVMLNPGTEMGILQALTNWTSNCLSAVLNGMQRLRNTNNKHSSFILAALYKITH